MYKLRDELETLDGWIAEANRDAAKEGALGFGEFKINVLGQIALFLANTGLSLVATQDLDAQVRGDWAVRKKLESLLMRHQLTLDPHSNEIWMPAETEWQVLYVGTHVSAHVADPDAVLVSKALKAPQKNQALLVEYLARGASDRFFELAERYAVDLESFL